MQEESRKWGSRRCSGQGSCEKARRQLGQQSQSSKEVSHKKMAGKSSPWRRQAMCKGPKGTKTKKQNKTKPQQVQGRKRRSVGLQGTCGARTGAGHKGLTLQRAWEAMLRSRAVAGRPTGGKR